jgi:hypothetical protein
MVVLVFGGFAMVVLDKALILGYFCNDGFGLWWFC